MAMATWFMKHTRSVVVIVAMLAVITLKTGAAETSPASPASPRVAMKFDFGPGKVQPGWIQILSTTIYSKERGYGFEPGDEVTGVDRGGFNKLRADFCTSDKPFFFSVALPEGNYRITVTLGDRKGESVTTVKAELRRLMLEKVQTASGKFETRTFVVNTRTPEIPGGDHVHLKLRERTNEFAAWDDKLTLEFNNSRPCLCALEITRDDKMPTVFLLGDSTVCDQPAEPWNSWGQMLTRFFKPGVAVANHSESGESLRSALGAKRLDKILSLMKPGDYLFIQFGHNDQKQHGPGVGAFTTYLADYKHFIEAARAKGGQPVVVTSMHRKTFNPDGIITNSLGDYPEAARQAAKEEDVPLIDLNAMSEVFYEALGTDKVNNAFQDPTHHNNYGSYELARCIVEGIRANVPDLARFLTDDAGRFNPAHPDAPENFKIPPSPLSSRAKPEGN
jgi:lysophospholipase L1-like esterase